MRRGRTVTLTEREVAALREAMALWEAEHDEHDGSAYAGRYGSDARRTAAALERVNAKLVAQAPR